MALRFWSCLVLLAPLLIWQGKRSKQNTPRLPEASGEPFGNHGQDKPPFKLTLIGESPIAGVGVKHHSEGLGPAISNALASLTNQQVDWHCLGINGATVQTMLNYFQENQNTTHHSEAILVMLGVNDTAGLTSITTWQANLHALINQHAEDTLWFFAPVPAMEHFTALPFPLSKVLGWRSQQLNHAMAEVCSEYRHCHFLPYGDLTFTSDLLAEDGFHPSAKGYKLMGEQLAQAMLAILQA